MIFTTCTSASSSTGLGRSCSINIAYNQQLPLCTVNKEEGNAGCRQPEDLCTADTGFKFDMTDSPTNSVRSFFLVIPDGLIDHFCYRLSLVFPYHRSHHPDRHSWYTTLRIHRHSHSQSNSVISTSTVSPTCYSLPPLPTAIIIHHYYSPPCLAPPVSLGAPPMGRGDVDLRKLSKALRL